MSPWLACGVVAALGWLSLSRRYWRRRAERVEALLRQDRQRFAAFQADFLDQCRPYMPATECVR